MKVLILDYVSSIGGVQSVEKNILKTLSKEYELYYIDPYNNEFTKEIKKVADVNVIHFNIWPSKSSLGWDNKFKKPIILLLMGPAYFIYIIKLGFKLKQIGIDLLYVHTKKSVISALIIKNIFRINYIYHAHGFGSYKHIRGIYKKAIINSEQVIAVSEDVRRKLLVGGIEENQVEVVYNGVDINKINKLGLVEPKENFNNSDLKIVSVSSINEGKGIHILIEAVNELLKEGKGVSLYIIGDIPNNSLLEYKKKLLDLSNKVDKSKINFIGWESNPYKYINKSDILVLPSIKEESFGMVIAEAMALKKVVIGSDIGGIPELIEDNVNGLLFEPGNSEDLKLKIEYIIDNTKISKSLSKNGFNSVNNKFSIEKQVLSISKILKRMK